MNPEQEALVEVVRALEGLGIPHMVTGSVASSYHGRPRSTHDADIVIDPSRDQLDTLAAGVLAINPGLDRGYGEKWARALVARPLARDRRRGFP